MAGFVMDQRRVKLPLSFRLIRGSIQTLSMVSPRLASQIGFRLFRTPRNRVLPTDDLFAQAERQTVKVNGDALTCYVWGSGKTVQLVHGWESGAQHLVPLIKPLIDAGYRVIAHDGPGHGSSKGNQADPIVFGEAAAAVAAELGPVYAVIGHSLGAAGTMIAVADSDSFRGLERAVIIGSPDRLGDTVLAFAELVGLSRRALDKMVEKFRESREYDLDSFNVSSIVSTFSVDGLIIHDEQDRQAPIEGARAIHASWPGSEAYFTTGYGHRRILKKEDVINRVVAFISSER
ncbi:MAG: alpha/beta hydrolase [Chloroflexota bacterium]